MLGSTPSPAYPARVKNARLFSPCGSVLKPQLRLYPVCFIVALAASLSDAAAAPPGTFTLRMAVDQFGYLPDMAKVAVISDPQVGFNAGQSYTPGNSLEVRAWGSNTVVYWGAPALQISGGTNSQSGDRNWWFDFSPVTR